MLANDADYKRGLFDKALRNTYEVLDQKLLQFKDSCSYQGLTLLAVLVTEEIVYVANCGVRASVEVSFHGASFGARASTR